MGAPGILCTFTGQLVGNGANIIQMMPQDQDPSEREIHSKKSRP